MADTIENLLVGLGLDSQAADKLLDDLNKVIKEAQEEARLKVKPEVDTKKTDESLKKTKEELLDIEKIIEDITKHRPVIRIKADAKTFQELENPANNFVTNLQSGIDRVNDSLGRLAVGVAAVSAALVATLGLASKNAADDETALRNLQTSFEDLSGAAQEFTNEIVAQNLALQAGDVQNALARLNRIGQAFELSRDQSLEFSKTLVTLASNFSLVTGQDFGTVLDKLQRALLRGGRAAAEFGVIIDNTRIEQEAARLGIQKTAEELTEAEEAQIRFNLIVAQTQGVAEKAASGTKTFNQVLNEMKAQVEEAFGDLGVIVNQTIQPFLARMVQAVRALREFIQENPNLAKALVAVTAALVAFGAALAGIIASLSVLNGALTFFTTIQAIGPAFQAAAAGSTAFAGAASGLGAVLGTLGPLLAVAGAAIAGFAVGTAIDKFFGFSDAAAKAATRTEQFNQAQENLKKLSKDTSIEMFNQEKAFLAQSLAAKKLTEGALVQLTTESLKYQQTIARVITDQEELTAAQDVYKRALEEGFTPLQAFQQAMNETARLQALAALGTERTARQEEEYVRLLSETSDELKEQLGLMDQRIEKEGQFQELTKQQQATLDEATKRAIQAQRDLDDQRARATESLEDDIALLKERANIEKQKTGVQATRDQIDKETNFKIIALQEEKARKDAEKAAEEEKKRIEDRKKQTAKFADEAIKAEESLAEARAKATETIDDDIAVLEERKQRELAVTGLGEQDKLNIIRKFAAAETAIREDEAAKQAKAIQEGVERATDAAVQAEEDLAEARADATETLADDLQLMQERLQKELELAKSEAERAAIKRKFLAEEKKLLEANAAAAKKDIEDRKKSLADFAKQQSNEARTRRGEGTQVAVERTAEDVRGQIKNITDEKDLKSFEEAAKNAFGNTLDDAKKKADEAFATFQDAEAKFKQQQRAGFGSTAERRAAEAEVAAARQEAQRTGAEFVAAQQKADAEQAKIQKEAADALKARQEKAKQEELARQQAQQQVDQQAADAEGAAAEAAPGEEAASPIEQQVNALQAAVDALTEQLQNGLTAVAEQIAGFIASATAFATQAVALTDLGTALQTVSEAQTGFITSLTEFTGTATETLTSMATQLTEVQATLADHTAQLAALAGGGGGDAPADTAAADTGL